MRRVAGGLLTIFLACGVYWAVRLAYAERLASQRTRAAIEQAVRLDPLNAAFQVRRAEIDPAAALSAMRIASRLNPRNSSIWIESAHIAEQNHDYQQAERSLLTAVQLDKTFAPRWRLAEYYYRRRNDEHFWPAMRVALAASYDDVSPLFRLCWNLAPDPTVVLPRALPPRADVLRQYLDFALAQRRDDVAQPVAAKLIERSSQEDIPVLLRYCDWLLEQHRTAWALEVWNSLARKNLLRDAALNPAQDRSVTNGSFERPFLAHGFDWRLPESEGVWAVRVGSPAALRFSFSGQQAETCEILSQMMPVLPGRRYRLGVSYETDGLPAEPGLNWRILEGNDGKDLLNEPGSLAASELSEQEQQYRFETSAHTEFIRLTLGYARIRGTSPISGSLYLRNVRLAFAR